MTSDYDGQTETIFLVRVTTSELGTPMLTDEQLRDEFVVDRRWWTLDELRDAATAFAPRRLPDLVADLIASGPPSAPIDVGV